MLRCSIKKVLPITYTYRNYKAYTYRTKEWRDPTRGVHRTTWTQQVRDQQGLKVQGAQSLIWSHEYMRWKTSAEKNSKCNIANPWLKSKKYYDRWTKDGLNFYTQQWHSTRCWKDQGSKTSMLHHSNSFFVCMALLLFVPMICCSQSRRRVGSS